MMTQRIRAVIAPGEILSEDIEARGWSTADFAAILGCTQGEVDELLTGHAAIDAAVAQRIGAALGTFAEMWMNLESSYRLNREPVDVSDVIERAKSFGAPQPNADAWD